MGAIIDLDGFQIVNHEGYSQFLCKELGVTYLYKPVTDRFTFRVGNFHELPYKSKVVASYVTRNIHGMRFEDGPSDLDQHDLPAILLEIQAICVAESGRFQIGFKGGHIERDLLRSLRIPYFNLERIACPKYNKLLEMFNVISSPSCGLHCFARNGVVVHCPQAETMLYRKWLLDE
jgi:hypothetical protein